MAKTNLINKSEIMKRAWELYRDPEYQGVRLGPKFMKERFRFALIAAWDEAKTDPVSELRQQIDHTKYLPFAINQAKRVKANPRSGLLQPAATNPGCRITKAEIHL